MVGLVEVVARVEPVVEVVRGLATLPHSRVGVVQGVRVVPAAAVGVEREAGRMAELPWVPRAGLEEAMGVGLARTGVRHWVQALQVLLPVVAEAAHFDQAREAAKGAGQVLPARS